MEMNQPHTVEFTNPSCIKCLCLYLISSKTHWGGGGGGGGVGEFIIYFLLRLGLDPGVFL